MLKKPHACISIVLLAACGAKAESQPGTETGPCIDFECVGDLMCLSDLCVDPNAVPTGGEDDSSSEGDESDTSETGPVQARAVDLLFIVDNSGSMGEEQALLALAVPRLVESLDAAGVDYQIGVTTTDNGNPWCSGTSPEGGALRLSSCRSRLAEFVFSGAQTIDRQDEACNDVCVHDSIAITPTTTEFDSTPAPRPWIQSIAGESNVSDASLTEALQCILPQGINGCGFEQPLESMRKAIQRSSSSDDEAYGFHRSDALFAVVLLTDEVDCSHNPDHDIIFLPEGNRMFWSLPEQDSPTSAVCWNAGVQCSGSGPTYTDCTPADVDVNGDSAQNPSADAALHPVSRYLETLEELGGHVAAINGVNSGYQDGSEITYQDSIAGTANDPNYQDNFGIGPGCTSVVSEPVPPVRIRALVEALDADDRHMYSVCNTSYDGAFDGIAAGILERLPS